MVSHGISPALKKTLIKVGMGHSKVPQRWCDGDVGCFPLTLGGQVYPGPLPLYTESLYLIYKCNKYPKEYMMKIINTLPLILIGALIGFLGIYVISSTCEEYSLETLQELDWEMN